MKISSLTKNLSSNNSLSSFDTIESPVMILDKSKRCFTVSKSTSSAKLLSKKGNESTSSLSQSQINSSKLNEGSSNPFIYSPFQQSSSLAPSNEFFLNSSYEEDQPENNGEISSMILNSNYCVRQESIEEEAQSESDCDDCHDIWDNSPVNEIGIDIQNSNNDDNNSLQLQFVQLFYIRSQFYQENRIAKQSILDEVSVIADMCDEQMNMTKCSQQIDQIEKQYNLSIRKNALQLARLHFNNNTQNNKIQSIFSKQPRANANLSLNPKKKFRIQSYHRIVQQTNNNSTSNAANNNQSQLQNQFANKVTHPKGIVHKVFSNEELTSPIQNNKYHVPLFKNDNSSKENLHRFTSNDSRQVGNCSINNSISSKNCKSRVYKLNTTSNEFFSSQSATTIPQSPQILSKKSPIQLNQSLKKLNQKLFEKNNNNNAQIKSKILQPSIIDRMAQTSYNQKFTTSKKVLSKFLLREDSLRI